jgi:lipopolysaccharide transport system ATP-binding protein
MSNIAIRIEGLSKQYRIGKSREAASGGRSLMKTAAGPFRYLANTLRPPDETEILWALRNVSFSVERGKVMGIIGRNGTGKSTLLKCLARITEPTEGRAEIHGRVAAMLEVGTGFHPELTGRENIFLSGAILGMKRVEIERKLDEIVDFSGIEKFLETPIKYYSSGMRVRLGFAVAAHLEPEILLVDEVLAVGDAEFQRKCLGKMSDVAHEGRTVLFVSHNMAAMQSLCTHGVFMQKGQVVVDGSINEAVSAYLRTVEQLQNTDLASRTERGGNGPLRLTDLKITQPDNPQSGTLVAGGPAHLEFAISPIPPKTVLNYLDFTVYDIHGNPVTYFSTAEHGSQDTASAGIGSKVICDVDELLLLPGRYRMNVGITANGEHSDHVVGAAFFNVEEGHVNGRPIAFQNGRPGSVIFSHRWVLPIIPS